MRYISGYRRRTAPRTDTGGGASDPRAGDGERVLFLTGILALALTLAVPMSRAAGSVPEHGADPRAAVAVMSTAAEDEADPPEETVSVRGDVTDRPKEQTASPRTDMADRPEEQTASARAEISVFDSIGRFFARLITGG